ncbi:MAG: Hpt domain-containing protein, partial [Planctomycetes bacterium]|nr:Hpt domain-containing protein [Planctomycetota bacterium]
LLTELVQIFLVEAPRLLAEIEAARTRGEGAAVRRAAHTIKGGLRMFGADAACDLAEEIEEIGRRGDLVSVAERLTRLRELYTDVEQILSEFLVEVSPSRV